MVIKYKAKFIRDGEVIIDDTSLIELGATEAEEESTSNGARQKSNNAWEQMIAQSEERSKDVDSNDDSAPPEK